MKYFTPYHSNFISANQNNINYIRYLKRVWNADVFYGTYINGRYVPVSKANHKPSLLTQNVGLQDVFNNGKGKRDNISMQPKVSLRDLVKNIPVTGFLRNTETQATVGTKDIATQISVPGVLHKKHETTSTETQVKVRTQEIATQVSCHNKQIFEYISVIIHKCICLY
ncbi:uncharacterized protein LOC117333125 [Pecten maximus]|uniref:uncharacterized protein LOC117333125 n=1 Tax=Pecten maximus TaxID=6579 RepID=UPI001457EDED|nr:uncharacterized protein LOC117333125 [Pecten maximus]